MMPCLSERLANLERRQKRSNSELSCVAWCDVVRVYTRESELRVIPAAHTESGDVHLLRLRGKIKKKKK
jgi:hypothetical protein